MEDSPSMNPTGASSLPALDLEVGGGASEKDYASKANWLRAAVLGAKEGLVVVASLMICVGAANQTSKAMVVSVLAGLVGGACCMAAGEYVSVRTQYDTQKAQMARGAGDDDETEKLPSPVEAAGVSALAFSLGASLPLLAGGFIKPLGVRVGVVCAVTSLGLGGIGAIGGILGGAPVMKSVIILVISGWFAMLIAYGVETLG